MHLQSLELFGFKSFADKTVFEFHEGVTAIVGPNGCGKSNVLDAVRWVLGEQSAKALRGGEMADVIFNGSDSRKAVGFGEVSLTFSNCAGELGVDWHDVRVTRRVYRDGNSEYLLNKTVCRLRDIQSLFADTGVGRSAYSIMEQGKIDLILSSRPEDRRAVFEEAAGITKYKTQKREALRKLEATEANLLRIGDIIKEVKRQIGSLQRQAGKARRYQTLMADLQVLDTHHSRRQFDAIQTEIERSREEAAHLDEAQTATHAKIEASENELAIKRRDLDDIDRRIADARAEVQRLQSETAALRNQIQFNRQRAEELGELIDRYENDIETAEAKRSAQATEIQEADALIAKTNQLLQTKQSEVDELTERLRGLRAERGGNEDELQALQSSLSKLQNRATALEEELNGIKARRDATMSRIAELDDTLTEQKRQVEQARTDLVDAQAATENELRTAETLHEKLRDSEELAHTQQAALAQAERDITKVERAIAEKKARRQVLLQMAEEGEGLEKGSQAVLKGLGDPNRIRPAIAGALVSNLNVAPEFVSAMEAALGRNLHAVVLRDAALATEIFQALNEQKLGQAALVLPELSGDIAATTPANLPDGALAWAREIVEVPESLRPLVHRLLGHVAIVANLEKALDLKKQFPRLQYATLAGEFVSAEGIVFGGRASAEHESLLGRKAIIATLSRECDLLAEELRTSGNLRDEAKNALEDATRGAEAARNDHHIASVRHSQASLRVLAAERAQQDAEQKVAKSEIEKTTLEQQVQLATKRILGLEEELQSQRTNLAEEEARKDSAERQHQLARAHEEEIVEKLSELRLAVATERQRHESLIHHRQPMAAREAELADLVGARRNDIATYRQRLSTQAKESSEAEAAILAQTSQRELAENKVATLLAERTTHLTAVAERESRLRTLRDALNDVRDSKSKHEVRQTQLELRSENIVEHVTRRYQIDVRTFTTDAFAFQKTLQASVKRRSKAGETAEITADDPASVGAAEQEPQGESVASREAKLEELIAELTRQLDNMGPVNLDAVQEYDELEQRYQFLETQNNDLIASRREVLDVIARINSTTQKLFSETFAQVRVNFREMFAELFGGGRADLSLLDENDALNCGIEIIARPPGKQLQSISLLSGGERTMTAVALLFAIYMVRPSPFCILDEMDAPLDESNINRFIRVLERFVSQSQFIIITHNKRTIAKADILYGVTMEERGVSKLVGMKLAAERGSDGELRRTASNGNGHGSAREHAARQGQFAMVGEAEEHPRDIVASR